MGKLEGTVAAVTGGASGIGEATVRRFIAEGAELAFADRDATRGRRVAAEIAAGGGKALFVEADVGHESTCLAFIQQTLERYGRLNVLVNNAGIRIRRSSRPQRRAGMRS
jgi:NAD(P)-dependent dehydrogenase (short-subunit alcohol dehydrogenase family)